MEVEFALFRMESVVIITLEAVLGQAFGKWGPKASGATGTSHSQNRQPILQSQTLTALLDFYYDSKT